MATKEQETNVRMILTAQGVEKLMALGPEKVLSTYITNVLSIYLMDREDLIYPNGILDELQAEMKKLGLHDLFVLIAANAPEDE